MQRLIISVTSILVLFFGHAGAQTTSTGTASLNPPIPASQSGALTTLAPSSESKPVHSSLGIFASQREQQAARVTALRKEIAALEEQLVDPRRAIQNSIEAMTCIEAELIRGFVSAPSDTEFTHTIEPFVSGLVRMRSARMNQLSSPDALDLLEAEKIRRQWLNKQDELHTAETLLAGIEKQLDTLRTDRELDRKAQDLTDLTKSIGVPTTPAAPPPGKSVTHPTPKP